jgi:hypothetical protein
LLELRNCLAACGFLAAEPGFCLEGGGARTQQASQIGFPETESGFSQRQRVGGEFALDAGYISLLLDQCQFTARLLHAKVEALPGQGLFRRGLQQIGSGGGSFVAQTRAGFTFSIHQAANTTSTIESVAPTS